MYRANQAARFCKSIDSFQPPSLPPPLSLSLTLPLPLPMVGRRRRFDPYSHGGVDIEVCPRLRLSASLSRNLGRIWNTPFVVVGAVSHLQLLRPFDLFPQRRRRRRTEFQINDRHYCSPPAASASFRAGDISARGETVALPLGCVKRQNKTSGMYGEGRQERRSAYILDDGGKRSRRRCL